MVVKKGFKKLVKKVLWLTKCSQSFFVTTGIEYDFLLDGTRKTKSNYESFDC